MYWTGGRNAGVRLRRPGQALEGDRHRVPRGVSGCAAGQFDRVRVLVTAGPTREPIDPVRYISNRSSGKMGYAIAEAALDAGHEVILISGPVNLAPPDEATFVRVSTSDEMFDAVHRHADKCDICVMCAAVADYKPAKVSTAKIKKHREKVSLELIPTRDVLDSLGHWQDRQFLVVGFAAETSDVEENAERKLREKNCDIVVANDVSSADSGMDSDLNEVTIVSRKGERRKILRTQKAIIARELVKIFANSATIMFDKKNVTVTETQLSEVIPNSSPVPRVAD
ncbi:MAG: bifunctional phosphopantothenoylcysteine decarboxylase/phosphopantothenate--cysteine ligase CoaBC [Verrucomicrobia bacterium]|nr:MAG: bifunctional phosphopantothenoylcysteine decarboxylase/phosphopantothenate--cysteine ligase CoaBC [Verrucomicrobiota bacterium]